MKLREFLNYRKECPVCQTSLITSFHSQKKQKSRYEDDRYLVLFDLNPLKSGSAKYKVGYSFGLDDNSLYVEFYTQQETRYQNETPFHLINKFKELDANLKTYKIYKHCTKCQRYSYSTDHFKLDYKACSIGEVSVNSEHIIMVQPINDGFKIYKLLNYYNSKETWLSYGKSKTDYDLTTLDLPNVLQTSTIAFTSHDETMNRISKLIIFS